MLTGGDSQILAIGLASTEDSPDQGCRWFCLANVPGTVLTIANRASSSADDGYQETTALKQKKGGGGLFLRIKRQCLVRVVNYLEREDASLKNLILCLFLGLVICGCASTPKTKIAPQDLSVRLNKIKKIGVISSGAFVFELGANGSKELNKEWSEKSNKILEQTSISQLRAAGFNVDLIKLPNEDSKVIEQFNAINRGDLQRYAYSARKLSSPLADSLKKLMAQDGLDAIMFVRSIDHVSTGGRQALRAAVAIFGVVESSGIAHEELVVVDSSQAVIYYCHKSEDGQDLRTEKGVANLFEEIIKDLMGS